MINFIIPLVGSLLTQDYVDWFLLPVFGLAFLSMIPDFIRRFIEWR